MAAETITMKKNNVAKKANLAFLLINMTSSLRCIDASGLFCFLFEKNLLWEAGCVNILNCGTDSAAALQLER
jgi:hypothetical protein